MGNGSLDAETLRKGQIMVNALHTIASGKKDYGFSVIDTDYAECRKIAKDALREVGCL